MVQQAESHVFTMARVTFHHLVGWLKASIGDLCYSKLFMIGFLSRNDRGICVQRSVDVGIGHQVCLDFCQINIQGSITPQGSSDGGHYLAHEAIKISVGWALDIKVSITDVIDGLIVYHEGTVRVLQYGVGGEDGVVGLNYSCGNLGGWVNGELQLGLPAIIDRETLGIVIGSIFLACDDLLRVEELVVGVSANFINDCGFQVYKRCPGHMLASTCLTEEGAEGVVSSPNGLVT